MRHASALSAAAKHIMLLIAGLRGCLPIRCPLWAFPPWTWAVRMRAAFFCAPRAIPLLHACLAWVSTARRRKPQIQPTVPANAHCDGSLRALGHQPVVWVLTDLQFLHLQFVRRTFKYCIAGSLSLARDHAALLGRFLPRLGPFGNPGWPFFFSQRITHRCDSANTCLHETVMRFAAQHRVFSMYEAGFGRPMPERAFPPWTWAADSAANFFGPVSLTLSDPSETCTSRAFRALSTDLSNDHSAARRRSNSAGNDLNSRVVRMARCRSSSTKPAVGIIVASSR